MIKRYKGFLESSHDLNWRIDILNEIEEVFLDLDDDWGFDISSSIKLIKGNHVFNIFVSKDVVELDQLKSVSDIIISKVLSINSLVSREVKLEDLMTSMKIYSIEKNGTHSQRTFNLYRNYRGSEMGLYWALPSYSGGNVSFSEAVKNKLLRENGKFNVKINLVFIIDENDQGL